jgi:choline-sulfatase
MTMNRPPNILFLMADQLAGPALSCYGHPVVQTPHLARLAEQGVVFDNAYCNSPLCAPARAALMTGQLPSRLGVYDNAAELPAAIPTFAHYLRAAGYATTLAGKMHFVGPDQVHGFEERLTTDIYPADFGWTPNWEAPAERLSWYHNMLSVAQAGPCVTTNQLDFDEEVAFHAERKIYELARRSHDQPFLLLASFTHPHDPYAIPRPYWDRYAPDQIPPPTVSPIPYDELDPHSRRIADMYAWDAFAVSDEQVRNARHAYFAAISYVDDQVGRLLGALAATGLDENTIILFTSDHGDMLGERGLWYKMTFFEWSARVPLLIHAPHRFAPRRVAEPVSLVDLLPTLLDLAGLDVASTLAAPIAGQRLTPLLHGDPLDQPHVVLSEYLAEGVAAPAVMIRRGSHKYIYAAPDTELLYTMPNDPDELNNLALQPDGVALREQFRAELQQYWNLTELRSAVIASQRRRRLIDQALRCGRYTPWDHQPFQDAAQRYMRNHLDLNELERRARFPAPPPVSA